MKEAAVLVPLCRDDLGGLRLVLLARTEAGLHGGQVSLPGGRCEPDDVSPLSTALRETKEEIGLDRDRIDVLASLEPLDTRTTGLRVYSFLARVRIPARWQLQSEEVATVLTPMVSTLADPTLRSNEPLMFPSWTKPRRVEQVALDEDHIVWGLTLRLLDPLLPRILAGEWTI